MTNYMPCRIKIIRVSTVPVSLNVLLKGQLKMLNEHFNIIGVSSAGDDLDNVREREGIQTAAIEMERHIAPFKDIVSLWKLIKIFRKEKPEIVHSITPKAGLLSMIAAKIAGVPIRIHTFTGLVFPTATGLKKNLLVFTDKLTCKCATDIIPEGNGVKNDLQANNITSKPLDILANGNVNGIDLDYFNPEKVQAKKDSSVFTFIFIGRIVRDKGICELCLAFKKIISENPCTRLLLVGNFEDELDPLNPEDKEFLLNNKNVYYAGYQNDIRPWLAKADALVFPSYREGFPNVVMQAGAMGLPAIVTDINGCNEIIRENENGVIIPSHNADALYLAMKKFISDKKKTDAMAKNARLLISSRYNQDLVWNALLDKYNKLLTDKGLINDND